MTDNSGLTQYIYYFLSTLVGTCVPIFFFTSGYLLLNKDVHLNKVWGKMIKIIILILFWRMITFPILHLFTGTPFDFKSIIIDTFSFHSGYTNHLWYLAALLFLYSVLPIIKFLFDENIKLFLFLLLTISTFVFGSKLLSQTFNIADILITTNNLQVIPFNNFISDFNFYSSSRGFGIVYFMIGGLIYRYPKVVKKTTPLNYFGLIILFIFLQFTYNVMYSLNFNTLYDPVWWTYDNIFTIPLVVTLYLFIDNFVVSNQIFRKIISLVGSNSLGIYLVHNIVIQLTSKYK